MENNETKTPQEEENTAPSLSKKVEVKSPSIHENKDLSEYKYFGEAVKKDSSGNSFLLAWRELVKDKNGNPVSVPDTYKPIPVTNQDELQAFMTKAPYFDKDGVLQYGYAPPAPTQTETTAKALNQYISMQSTVSALGHTNSPEAIKWAQNASKTVNEAQSTAAKGSFMAKVKATVFAATPSSEEVLPPSGPFVLEDGSLNPNWFPPA